MTDEQKLLPCPFCDSKNIRTTTSRTYAWPANVICNDCGCNGPLYGDKQYDKAIKAWNTRKGEK